MFTSITVEFNGIHQEKKIDELKEFLSEMKRISSTFDDFVEKVIYSVTDQTSGISQKDKKTLELWYFKPEFEYCLN